MGEMYEKICSWENLRLAHHKTARGKRGKRPAATFEYNLADHLLELQHELVTQTYQPGAYHSFYIHDPKHRLISAAPFRDRVIHHALCNVTEPIFERSFIYDSYANRVGKGTHRALDRAQAFARRFRYVLQFDVEQLADWVAGERTQEAVVESLLGCKSSDFRSLGHNFAQQNALNGQLAFIYEVLWRLRKSS